MNNGTKLMLGILIPAFSCSAGNILYSNIGAGFPGDSTSNYFDSLPSVFLGTNFTTTAAGTLASLEFDANVSTSPVTVGLYTDSGSEPGSLLESWSAVIPIGTGATPPLATILTSVANPSLSASTKYWLVFTQTSVNQIIWFANDTGVNGGFWTGASATSLSNAFATSAAPGIQLNSLAAVPEPATVVLLGLGFAALAFIKRATL